MACFLFCFGLVSLQTVEAAAATFIALFLIAVSAGFPVGSLLGKLLLMSPFVLLMTVPIIFGNGLAIEPDRVEFAALLALKALSALIVMVLMVLGQPLQAFLSALAQLRLPPVFLSVLFLSFQYTFLLIRKLKEMQKALASRFFTPSLKKESLHVYGSVLGGMLVQSMDRAEQVHKAMMARGFTGRMPASPPGKIKTSDYWKAAMFLIYIVGALLVERWGG